MGRAAGRAESREWIAALERGAGRADEVSDMAAAADLVADRPVIEAIAEVSVLAGAGGGDGPQVSTELTHPPAPADTQPHGASRWHPKVAALDPHILTDPHWLALAAGLDRAEHAGLDRAEHAGLDIASTLTELAATTPLPPDHRARALHYRLIGACPAAATPAPALGTPDPAGAPGAGPEAAPTVTPTRQARPGQATDRTQNGILR